MTGNTGISAVTLGDGKQRMVRFTGTPLITVGANLVGNNGGRNIQVAVSDMALFVGHPSGVVLFWLIRFNGGPVEQEGTTLTLTSTDASDVLGPTVIFDYLSPSPAANDGLGRITFNGKTRTGVTVPYADIWATIETLTNGSEAGEFVIRARGSGGLASADYRFTRRGMIGVVGSTTAPLGKSSAFLLNGELGSAAFGDYTGAPVSSLVPGTASGARIEGAFAGHLVLGIRDNDAAESVSIVSYDGTGAYSRLVAKFQANGAVTVPQSMTVGTALQVGSFSATGASDGKFFNNSAGLSLVRNVTGNASHVRIFNPNGQVGSINSSSTTTAHNTSSDERLKNLIGLYAPLEALANIRADPTRKFTWIADGSVAVGWGAQTSYAVSNDLASPGVGNPGDEDFQPWGVDQAKRTPYLWAVVPWLADRLDDVEAR